MTGRQKIKGKIEVQIKGKRAVTFHFSLD